jgi:RHS repeat-associated protein
MIQQLIKEVEMKNIKTTNNIKMKEGYEKITYLTKEIVFLEFALILSMPVASSLQEYTLIYDGNGNLITGDGKYRVYNEFNQLVEVYSGNDTSGEVLEFYLWHPTEDRILMKKVFNGSVYPEEVVVYVNDNFDKSYTNPSADAFINETYYVYDDYGLVGEIVYNTTFRGTDDHPVFPASFLKKIFYHSDHLGSTTVITNSSGGVVEKTFYDPYGEIISGGEIGRYQYEGKEFSFVTGDYDFNFRKYDPELGIFTQPDAVLVNVYDPQQLNRYSFERRNPYGYVDRDGKVLVAPIFLAYGLGIGLLTLQSYGLELYSGIREGRSFGDSYSAGAMRSGQEVGGVFLFDPEKSAKFFVGIQFEPISYILTGAEIYKEISGKEHIFQSSEEEFKGDLFKKGSELLPQLTFNNYYRLNLAYNSGCGCNPAYSSCLPPSISSSGGGNRPNRPNTPTYDEGGQICTEKEMCFNR